MAPKLDLRSMTANHPSSDAEQEQDALYLEFAGSFGAAIERLARGYEANEASRQDLVQEIHLALWRSFAGFDRRCSLRTWVYRVAHNVGVSHTLREQKGRPRTLVSLDEVNHLAGTTTTDALAETRTELDLLLTLIRELRAVDRQVILLYLEGETAEEIGEVTGLSPQNVATKIHRIKRLLTDRLQGGRT